MSAKSPASVAEKATIPGVLHTRRRLTLIGLMGTSTAPSALLLTRSGRTLKVAPGDRTPGGKVVAIDKSGIILQSGGAQIRLAMPD